MRPAPALRPGKAQTVDVIEVKWPTTQKIERFTQVKANQILTIREGSGIVEGSSPKLNRGSTRLRQAFSTCSQQTRADPPVYNSAADCLRICPTSLPMRSK